MSLARQVRILRAERGWTQQQLAAASGIDQTTISRIELGKSKRLSGDILLKLARAFGRTVEELNADDDDSEVDAEVDRIMADVAGKVAAGDIPRLREIFRHGLMSAKREAAHEPKQTVRLIAEGTITYDAVPPARNAKAAGA